MSHAATKRFAYAEARRARPSVAIATTHRAADKGVGGKVSGSLLIASGDFPEAAHPDAVGIKPEVSFKAEGVLAAASASCLRHGGFVWAVGREQGGVADCPNNS